MNLTVHPADTPDGRVQETQLAQHLWWNHNTWDEPSSADTELWGGLGVEHRDYWIARASLALDGLRRHAL